MNDIQTVDGTAADGEIIPDRNSSRTAMVEAAVSRAMQEVEAAMVVAKRFPRDETKSIMRIKTACKRVGLAESAMYSYPRGKETITGPSIRLAECLAQNWGNLDFGIIEMSQHNGESEVMAYAWDLETNCRQVKVFKVKHRRDTRSGGYALKDQRDIYELVANNGARRLRACILGVIPGDIQDLAIEECEKTLKGDKEPIKDRIRKMIEAFDALGVTQEMIEVKLGHKGDAVTERDIVSLRKIYKTLIDNQGRLEDYFQAAQPAQTAQDEPKTMAEVLAEKLKGDGSKAKPGKLASKEQVAQIERLMFEKKVPAEKFTNLVQSTGAASLTKATAEQAVQIISNLQDTPAGE